MKYSAAKQPTEHTEQVLFVQWTLRMQKHVPELGLMFAIPNGGKRSKFAAARLKLEGVKSGVPDLMLPVARQNCHGLFIEMKRIKDGSLSKNQKDFIAELRAQGYKVEVAEGFEKAKQIIIDYFKGYKNAS